MPNQPAPPAPTPTMGRGQEFVAKLAAHEGRTFPDGRRFAWFRFNGRREWYAEEYVNHGDIAWSASGTSEHEVVSAIAARRAAFPSPDGGSAK